MLNENKTTNLRCLGIVLLLLLVFFLNSCGTVTSTEQAKTETTKVESTPTYYFDEDGNCYDEDDNWVNPEDDMEYWDVDSSAFDVVGYSESTQTLDVQFDNSGWYRYTRITPSLFNQFLNAESLGGFYNDYIKGQYPCTDLE